MNERGIKFRLRMAGAFLLLGMMGLGWRLGHLHFGSDNTTGNRRVVHTELHSVRGKIFDRNGQANLLAMDVALKDVWTDPSLIADEPDTVWRLVSELAPLLQMPEDVLAGRLHRPGRQFAYLKRRVPVAVADQIAARELPGVFLRHVIARRYPQDGSMGQVLGFVNHEGVGSAGVEQVLDRYLRGAPGFRESALNAKRQELYERRGRHVPAMSGASVHLTIDQNIQHIAEQALAAAAEQYQAAAGVAIVQHVATGEILAMANWPFFDPNHFRESTAEARMNRAVAFNYEPGSTFKPVVLAAALHEGIVTPETMIDCEQGAWTYLNRVLHDVAPHGTLSLADVVRKSSNIGTAKVGIRLGDRRLDRYLREFGFGDRLGVDLPGEERGILHPVSRWSRLDSSRISIGQAISVTPLQLVNALCALGNEGRLMRPHVIREIRSADGHILYRARPETIGRPVDAETAATMLRLLSGVMDDGGTGWRGRVAGYDVAGKTGTAQKVVDGAYSSTAFIASFVGLMPAENPEIGVLVVLDEPQTARYGGVVAAPAFSRIAEQTARYLDVAPAPAPVQMVEQR